MTICDPNTRTPQEQLPAAPRKSSFASEAWTVVEASSHLDRARAEAALAKADLDQAIARYVQRAMTHASAGRREQPRSEDTMKDAARLVQDAVERLRSKEREVGIWLHAEAR